MLEILSLDEPLIKSQEQPTPYHSTSKSLVEAQLAKNGSQEAVAHFHPPSSHQLLIEN